MQDSRPSDAPRAQTLIGTMPGFNPSRTVKTLLAPLWYRLPDSRAKRWAVEAKRRVRVIVRAHDRRVGIDRLYLGGTIGHPAHEFAALIGEPQWPSTRLTDGPHADLYRRFERSEAIPRPGGEAIEDVPYVDLALRCIEHAGEFCERTNLNQIIELIEHRRGLWLEDQKRPVPPVDGPALVRRIRGSDAYEIIDGHHRLARAWVRGTTHTAVDVTWSTAPPMQHS